MFLFILYLFKIRFSTVLGIICINEDLNLIGNEIRRSNCSGELCYYGAKKDTAGEQRLSEARSCVTGLKYLQPGCSYIQPDERYSADCYCNTDLCNKYPPVFKKQDDAWIVTWNGNSFLAEYLNYDVECYVVDYMSEPFQLPLSNWTQLEFEPLQDIFRIGPSCTLRAQMVQQYAWSNYQFSGMFVPDFVTYTYATPGWFLPWYDNGLYAFHGDGSVEFFKSCKNHRCNTFAISDFTARPTVECYTSRSENLFGDNCRGHYCVYFYIVQPSYTISIQNGRRGCFWQNEMQAVGRIETSIYKTNGKFRTYLCAEDFCNKDEKTANASIYGQANL